MLGGMSPQQGPQPMSGGLAGSTALSRSGGSTSTAATTQNQAARAASYSNSVLSPSMPEGGVMSGGSRGVFGMPGIKLGPAARGQNGTVISSTNHDVKLDSGTQLVIQVTTAVR